MNGTHQLLNYADGVNLMDENTQYYRQKYRSFISCKEAGL